MVPSATALWIGSLILQILTTLTSAYSTFNTLVDRLFINKIKVSLFLRYFTVERLLFLDHRTSSNNTLYAFFRPKIDMSNYLPDHIYFHDPLDDPISQTLGKLSVLYDK